MNRNQVKYSLVLLILILLGIIGLNTINFEKFTFLKLKNFNLFSEIIISPVKKKKERIKDKIIKEKKKQNRVTKTSRHYQRLMSYWNNMYPRLLRQFKCARPIFLNLY